MADRKPNIVFFFWDNFGWGELGVSWAATAAVFSAGRPRRGSMPSPGRACGC